MKICQCAQNPVAAYGGLLFGTCEVVEHTRKYWNGASVFPIYFQQFPICLHQRERRDQELTQSGAQGMRAGQIVGERSRAARKGDFPGV